LGVPRLELARPTGQPQQNHALFLPLDLFGKCRLSKDVKHGHVGGERSRPCGSRSTEGSTPAKTVIGRAPPAPAFMGHRMLSAKRRTTVPTRRSSWASGQINN